MTSEIKLSVVLIFLISFLLAPVAVNAQWKKIDVGTDASFRGLDVVSKKVVWASGTGGTVIRSVDGGKNWDIFKVKGAEKLDFRDIEAFNENIAYILSIGNGDNSRIYKTTDGGKTWKLQFTNTIKDAFFDSIAFWDENNGLAQSDPVNGKYVFYRTRDGENWTKVNTDKMPAAKKGEAAFAASGTCIITKGKKRIWLITGGMDARVFYSKNRGETWKVVDTPMVNGTAGSGIFSIAMRTKKRGVIVGGNYEKPNDINSNLAVTKNGGKSWRLVKGLNGYRSGVTYINKKSILAVGSDGWDISYDGGKTWENYTTENGIKKGFNAVDSKGKNAIWTVGAKGLVAKFIYEVTLD